MSTYGKGQAGQGMSLGQMPPLCPP